MKPGPTVGLGKVPMYTGRGCVGGTSADRGALDTFGRKKPRAREDITHLPLAQLTEDILKKEQRIAEIMDNMSKLLARDA